VRDHPWDTYSRENTSGAGWVAGTPLSSRGTLKTTQDWVRHHLTPSVLMKEPKLRLGAPKIRGTNKRSSRKKPGPTETSRLGCIFCSNLKFRSTLQSHTIRPLLQQQCFRRTVRQSPPQLLTSPVKSKKQLLWLKSSLQRADASECKYIFLHLMDRVLEVRDGLPSCNRTIDIQELVVAISVAEKPPLFCSGAPFDHHRTYRGTSARRAS